MRAKLVVSMGRDVRKMFAGPIRFGLISRKRIRIDDFPYRFFRET
jgi:hypothetical protein